MKSTFFVLSFVLRSLLLIFMLKYALTHIFSLCILLEAIRRTFDRKPDKLLPRTLYRVTAHVISKVRKGDAMKDALFAPLSNYREGASKLTGISNKTLSRIKAESEKAILASRKPRSHRMKLGDFDKCEIYINCKTTHTNKTTNHI